MAGLDRSPRRLRGFDVSISHTGKSIALADKLTAKAEGVLAGIEMEMIVMKWPSDFRVIMWETIAHIASIRADEAKRE